MRTFVITLFYLAICTTNAKAEFLGKQFTPSLTKASDETSLYLWVGGATAVLLVQSLDENFREMTKDHRGMPSWLSNIGDKYVGYGFNSALALGQYYFDKKNGADHIHALLFTGVVTEVLKILSHRKRPDESDFFSFPSGHTSSAFTTATSLTYAYGWNAGIPAFAAAILTGLSRMADNRHWASDVTAGAFLGVIWGRATYSDDNKDKVSKSKLYPYYENQTFGFNYQLEI